MVLQTKELVKSYTIGEDAVPVLCGVTMTAEKGEFIAIMGPSGSGKSTLLNILGCLDTPTSGSYQFNGSEIAGLKPARLAKVRNYEIGFVFQGCNLLPRFSLEANVELPLVYQRIPKEKRQQRVAEILERVGLADRRRHLPAELSGGQRQRGAIARALVKSPSVIFADEPTGNLDSKTAADIMQLISALSKDGNTIVLITHDSNVAAHAHRTLTLIDGRLSS